MVARRTGSVPERSSHAPRPVSETGPIDATTRLALLAGQGDHDAFELLVRSTQAEIWRYCAHVVGRDSADDVTQDVYVRALRALRTYRGDASALTFLLGIARRACIDEIRRATRRRALLDRYRRGRPRSEAVSDGDRVELDDLVRGLDADRREAFVFTQLLGLSYEEAAAICGCPIGTIRSRVARARADLVAALGTEGELAGGA